MNVLTNAVTSWRTSLTGIAAGALNLHMSGLSWKNILLSCLFGGVGVLAKDSNVTGGTTPNK